MPATIDIPVTSAADLRAVLLSAGFEPREVPTAGFMGDPSQRQFTLRHPANAAVELVAFINVVTPFDKDGKYHNAALYTLVNDHPLNVPGHPLNISVGLSEIHDAALYGAIVNSVAARFVELEVDEVATRW